MIDIRCFLLDMDGTFYLGRDLIDGSLEFLEILKKQGKDFLFLTNNSSKNRVAYQRKLAQLGCQVDEEKVFTSGEATTIYLSNIAPNAKVFLPSTEYLEEEFKRAGFALVNNTDERPEYVILGFDTALTYDSLYLSIHWQKALRSGQAKKGNNRSYMQQIRLQKRRDCDGW